MTSSFVGSQLSLFSSSFGRSSLCSSCGGSCVSSFGSYGRSFISGVSIC